MGEYGELYARGRERIIDVVGTADPGTAVQTCPAWTVKDALAHLAGVAADILAGNLEGAPGDPWTAAQVDARRDKTLDEVVAEWQETGPQIDAIVDSFGPTGAQLLFDLTTHEHDIRHALGLPALLELPAHAVALGFVLESFGGGAPGPLQIATPEKTWLVPGGDGPAATLTASSFDVLRAMSGRRSERQIRAMRWEGDPTPFLPMFASGPFTMPTEDVVEG